MSSFPSYPISTSGRSASNRAACPCPRHACPPIPPAPVAPKKETLKRSIAAEIPAKDPVIRTLFAYEADDESESSSTTSSESFNVRSSLKIYFDHAHGEYYDLIVVSPIAELYDDEDDEEEDEDFCKFYVKYYYDRTADSYRTCNEMILTADEMYDYINRILKMVAVDQEPYAKVSFDIPMFPSVSYTPQRLCKKGVRKLVLSAAGDYLMDCLNGEYPIDILNDYDGYDEDAEYSDSE